MKTKFLQEKGRISLIVDHGKDKSAKKQVLAAMTLYEGTGCWTLIDIRLSSNPTAHPWSGSGNGEDFYSSYKPSSPEEAETIKGMLKEFQEQEDGTLRWCTYRNIVRGETSVNGYTPIQYVDFERHVLHSKSSAFEKLKDIQTFWEAHEGTIAQAKIPNPYAQPSDSIVSMRLIIMEHAEKKPNVEKNAEADTSFEM